MDIKIKDGDWAHTGGKLAYVEGIQEILQHAVMRLAAKRDRFYPDSRFGSYLYQLKDTSGPERSLLAMQYAAQALEGMPEVWPEQVVWHGNTAVITLWVRGEEKEVSVTV